MSKYIVCQTKYASLELLLDSLEEIGIKRDHVEVHEQPANLHGYRGDSREQKAHVIIRKQFVGSSSNDIGFLRTEDGTYQTYVSDFDRSQTLGRRILSKSMGGMGELDQVYAKRAVLKVVTDNYGHQIKSCIKKGKKIHIRVQIS